MVELPLASHPREGARVSHTQHPGEDLAEQIYKPHPFCTPTHFPVSGQADLMPVVPGHGLEDRDTSSWLEPSAIPGSLLAPQLSVSQRLEEAAKIQRCVFVFSLS